MSYLDRIKDAGELNMRIRQFLVFELQRDYYRAEVEFGKILDHAGYMAVTDYGTDEPYSDEARASAAAEADLGSAKRHNRPGDGGDAG